MYKDKKIEKYIDKNSQCSLREFLENTTKVYIHLKLLYTYNLHFIYSRYLYLSQKQTYICQASISIKNNL